MGKDRLGNEKYMRKDEKRRETQKKRYKKRETEKKKQKKKDIK